MGEGKGADGSYRDSAGLEVKASVYGNAGTDTNQRTTLAVADYWKRVGVAGEPYIVPSGADRSVVPSRPGFLVSTLKTEIDRRFTSPRPSSRRASADQQPLEERGTTHGEGAVIPI